MEVQQENFSKKGKQEALLRLVARRNPEGMRGVGVLEEHAERLEKTGKKKNWLEGYGVKVRVSIAAV